MGTAALRWGPLPAVLIGWCGQRVWTPPGDGSRMCTHRQRAREGWMLIPYTLMYRLGFAPWERRPVVPTWQRVTEGPAAGGAGGRSGAVDRRRCKRAGRARPRTRIHALVRLWLHPGPARPGPRRRGRRDD